MSVGSRRNGTRKYGSSGTHAGRHSGHSGHYAGRHATTGQQPALNPPPAADRQPTTVHRPTTGHQPVAMHHAADRDAAPWQYAATGHHAPTGHQPAATHHAADRDTATWQYAASGHHAPTGREAATGRKAARLARKVAPAAAIAATLAAGVAAYGITSASGKPDPANVSAALSAPMVLSAFTHAGVGKTDTTSGVLLHPAHASTSATHSSATTGSAGKPSARPTQSATPQASASQSSQPATRTPAQSPTTPAPSPSASASQSASTTTVSCSDNSYLLPANVTAIVNFLLAHGYSHNAVAGIAGNIYQESKGDPESVGMGGGGLIGFTPLPSGYVTGNPAADLQTQLSAVLTYNNGWSAYLPELNSAASPADAAYIYVTDFERAGIPAASTREASADAVASACNI